MIMLLHGIKYYAKLGSTQQCQCEHNYVAMTRLCVTNKQTNKTHLETTTNWNSCVGVCGDNADMIMCVYPIWQQYAVCVEQYEVNYHTQAVRTSLRRRLLRENNYNSHYYILHAIMVTQGTASTTRKMQYISLPSPPSVLAGLQASIWSYLNAHYPTHCVVTIHQTTSLTTSAYILICYWAPSYSGS